MGEGEGGIFERTESKHVYYQGSNRSPAKIGCVRQVLGAGALGRPRGMGWRGRQEGGSAWGIHVNPWLIHVSVWQKLLQYSKVISLQLIKINGKKKETKKNGNNTEKYKELKCLVQCIMIKKSPQNFRYLSHVISQSRFFIKPSYNS